MGKSIKVAGGSAKRRSRTEELGQSNERRFRMALEAANAGAWEWDTESNTLSWSDETWKLYGLNSGDYSHAMEAWSAAVHPEDWPKVRGDAAAALLAGRDLAIEYRIRKHGEDRWLLSRAQPAVNSKGVDCYLGITLDITHRIQSEIALRQREENLRRFSEAAPVAIAMFDQEMRYLAASRRFRNDFHLGDQPLIGRSHYDLFPEMPERWFAVHKRCLLGATESHPGELFVRATGEEQWVRWEVQPWHRLDGSVGGLVLFSEEITAQKLSERVLQESERRLRLAQQIAQVGAFDWNVQTGEQYWSAELLAMYGLSESTGAPARQTWESMIHPDDRPEVLRQLEQSLESGRLEAEWRIVMPDASERWMTGRGSLIRDDAGQPLQLVGLLLDVTERKCAELEIRRLNADLERRVRERTAELVTASQEMEAFAYSVSHDLRAPLRGIDGWSLALAEDYGRLLDARAHQYIDRVRSETQRMGLLIDDMLELSRVGRSRMHVGDVGLSELVQLVAGRLREGNGGRDIEFAIEPGLTARGDVRLLEIALTNLLENAVKFTATRERALIEFGAKTDGDEAIYSVRDNGVGFDMRYAGSLFGPFQRLHKTAEFPGTGIGLAIVQRVINRHSGRIWAEAEQDRGAAFFFTLGHQ